LDPAHYSPFVTEENGKLVLHVLLKKALYGTLEAAKLFWQTLSNVLMSWGFVINPYDCCVANKEINGSQFSIIWHVDDLKISHFDPKVVTDVIQMLFDGFGKEASLTIKITLSIAVMFMNIRLNDVSHQKRNNNSNVRQIIFGASDVTAVSKMRGSTPQGYHAPFCLSTLELWHNASPLR
jgi:hypothetical protein